MIANPYGDWQRWATMGFYAYDWQDVHRLHEPRVNRYELLAVPSDPLELAAVPEALCRQPRLGAVRFAKMALVDVSDL